MQDRLCSRYKVHFCARALQKILLKFFSLTLAKVPPPSPLEDAETGVLKAVVERSLKDRFTRERKLLGLTETAVLRTLVNQWLETRAGKGSEISFDPANSELERMTVRFPRFAMEPIRDRAQRKGFAQPARYVAALVQSSLTKIPVMTETELNALRESNRELAAVGRNLNQIAKALNESFHETDRLKLEDLEAMRTEIRKVRGSIRILIQASSRSWGAVDDDN